MLYLIRHDHYCKCSKIASRVIISDITFEKSIDRSTRSGIVGGQKMQRGF
jgi:hypothetical protein